MYRYLYFSINMQVHSSCYICWFTIGINRGYSICLKSRFHQYTCPGLHYSCVVTSILQPAVQIIIKKIEHATWTDFFRALFWCWSQRGSLACSESAGTPDANRTPGSLRVVNSTTVWRSWSECRVGWTPPPSATSTLAVTRRTRSIPRNSCAGPQDAFSLQVHGHP